MECPISTREKGRAGQLGATLVCLSVVMSNEHTSVWVLRKQSVSKRVKPQLKQGVASDRLWYPGEASIL